MELGLKNKNVLIIGASKGIGRGIAMGFAAEGCRLVIIARSEELLQEVQSEALFRGALSCDYVVQDIMECDTQKFADDLMDQFGIFDVVVHNVGGSLISRDHLGGADDWNYALKFNAVAAIDMNSKLIPP
ncbi:MAG: SDR family NAD(P)-dependent oxidoreductase, partial [Clostridia bacterium]|nr:SDR family NAD(P)-dependent oxidoreductase [Clostridia bacterium]